MKSFKLFFILGIVISLFSCEKSKIDLAHQTSYENEVYKKILALGFNKNQITEFQDYYLVEGDIRFNKPEKLNERTLKQAECDYRVSDIYRNIKVYLNSSSFSALNLTGVVQAVNSYYNQLNTNLKFTIISNPSEANIIITNSGIGGGFCAVAEFPTSNGLPGANIYVDENFLNQMGYTNEPQLVFLLAHEMGHCVGLRHTNWLQYGEAAAMQIPNTPYNDGASVMNGGTCGHYWNGFSTYDTYALNYMYPLQPDYISATSSMYMLAEASSRHFYITSNCSWTVSSNQSWLTVNTQSGTGPGTIYMSATENTDINNTRNATVTITYGAANQTFDVTVTQAAAQIQPTFDFTVSHMSGTPTCNTGYDYNPLMSEIDLWYIFGTSQTFAYQTIQIEATTDPAPLTFDHIDIMYDNISSDWLDYSYNETTRQLTIWTKSNPGQEEWALISLTSGSVSRKISVHVL